MQAGAGMRWAPAPQHRSNRIWWQAPPCTHACIPACPTPTPKHTSSQHCSLSTLSCGPGMLGMEVQQRPRLPKGTWLPLSSTNSTTPRDHRSPAQWVGGWVNRWMGHAGQHGCIWGAEGGQDLQRAGQTAHARHNPGINVCSQAPAWPRRQGRRFGSAWSRAGGTLTRRRVSHAVRGAARQLGRQVRIHPGLLAAGVAPSAAAPGMGRAWGCEMGDPRGRVCGEAAGQHRAGRRGGPSRDGRHQAGRGLAALRAQEPHSTGRARGTGGCSCRRQPRAHLRARSGAGAAPLPAHTPAPPPPHPRPAATL